jgi:glycosyltransferase involved in cell wall biosynthesis
MNPLVSIVLATHVYDCKFRQAVASCLDQTFQDFELIIMVNGANSQFVFSSISSMYACNPKVTFHIANHNFLNFSLSLGIHLSKGSLVARMDADDISYPERLEKQVSFMISNPEVGVLGTSYDIIDSLGNVLSTRYPPATDSKIRSSLFLQNPLCHPSVMFRRDTVSELGGYLGGLHAEDYDLWARLATSTSIKFANLSEVCIGYRSYGSGQSRRNRAAYASMTAIQVYNFVYTKDSRWLFAAIVSYLKSMFRSAQ